MNIGALSRASRAGLRVSLRRFWMWVQTYTQSLKVIVCISARNVSSAKWIGPDSPSDLAKERDRQEGQKHEIIYNFV